MSIVEAIKEHGGVQYEDIKIDEEFLNEHDKDHGNTSGSPSEGSSSERTKEQSNENRIGEEHKLDSAEN